MRCGIGRRRGLDLVLLWLWRRPAATAPIGTLAWEPPYATGAALKRQKKKKKKKKKDKKLINVIHYINSTKKKTHMSLIDREKPFERKAM